jgi:hypothetical protein
MRTLIFHIVIHNSSVIMEYDGAADSLMNIHYLECVTVVGCDRLFVLQYTHHAVVVLLVERLSFDSQMLCAATMPLRK